ncbi:glycosyltransferase [Selenomonas ruminantium]|uniref:Glycosyltransferase involved in cell wall bisynthesis n=1 Tax=Selenomonas ruminantium TaxID=971 RepID=A0A1H3WRJ8_SELRU|nr:glycosyltransferase [Selenomonas ruminantium]SDZ88974.1 Glycosyltransferase involved in cell wall bisynthesis [Selenomonas ruminantium]
MRVLLVNSTYNIGSTGKLIYNFYNYLIKNGHEVSVITGCANEDKPNDVYVVCSKIESKFNNLLGRITGLNDCFAINSTRKAEKIIHDLKPDVVFLGNIHGHYINVYRLYRAIKNKSIPIIQMMWDEFAMTGSCAYPYDCEKYYTTCSNCPRIHDYPKSLFFDTSQYHQEMKRRAYIYDKLAFVGIPYTVERAKNSYLLKGKRLFALDEAVDQIGRYYPRNVEILRNDLGISEQDKVIVNVCVYPESRKGGQYYLELARKCEDMTNLKFIHVGFMGDESECPSNYIPIGFVEDQDMMPFYYSIGDLFVCTSLAETQPNAVLEALSCGTRICGFNTAGVPSCAEYPFGQFVEIGDIETIVDIIIKTPKKTNDTIVQTRRYAETRFSSIDYNDKLLHIAEDMVMG